MIWFIRYYIGRAMVHGGLHVLPECQVKRDLLELFTRYRAYIEKLMAGEIQRTAPEDRT